MSFTLFCHLLIYQMSQMLDVNELYSINSNPWLITYKLYNLQHY